LVLHGPGLRGLLCQHLRPWLWAQKVGHHLHWLPWKEPPWNFQLLLLLLLLLLLCRPQQGVLRGASWHPLPDPAAAAALAPDPAAAGAAVVAKPGCGAGACHLRPALHLQMRMRLRLRARLPLLVVCQRSQHPWAQTAWPLRQRVQRAVHWASGSGFQLSSDCCWRLGLLQKEQHWLPLVFPPSFTHFAFLMFRRQNDLRTPTTVKLLYMWFLLHWAMSDFMRLTDVMSEGENNFTSKTF